eukprot:scaffold13227_cov117-Isochrysis_galbana.AAC.1
MSNVHTSPPAKGGLHKETGWGQTRKGRGSGGTGGARRSRTLGLYRNCRHCRICPSANSIGEFFTTTYVHASIAAAGARSPRLDTIQKHERTPALGPSLASKMLMRAHSQIKG